MKEINITGQKREALGKKASKQYRKEGLVPCNIYGEKKCENGRPVAMSFVAPMSELRKLVYTPSTSSTSSSTARAIRPS